MPIQTLKAQAFLLVLVLALGCGGTREAAVITERPAPATEQTPPPVTEAPVVATPQLTPFPPGMDTVRARRFDTGKMWTFDNPPLAFFQQEYGFTPDNAWFEKARLGALRFATYCSASFVSPNGLVLTNHHCGRESVTEVSGTGEDLLETGFYAAAMSEERRVPGLFVDQLIEIRDVTGDVANVAADAREMRANALGESLTAEAKRRDTTLVVQVITLYNGGRYSAYTFKRYRDVRLVLAPEVKLGFFGGDPDNFTYPRYALDMTIFRVYGQDGKPLNSPNFFKWSTEGTREGDAVFVIGNPGSTSRLNSVSQLEFERDYQLPQQLDLMESRAALLDRYIDDHPAESDSMDLRNAYFDISNSIKATTGQLGGLRDPYLIARRVAAERELQQAIQATDSLRTAYGNVLRDLRDLQRVKVASVDQNAMMFGFDSPALESHVMVRALYAYFYDAGVRHGGDPERLANLKNAALDIADWPKGLESEFLTARFRTLQETLPAGDPTLRRVLNGQSPEDAAARIVASTALIDSARYAAILDKGFSASGDPMVQVIDALAPLYLSDAQQREEVATREGAINARLSLARFAIQGTRIPPDASFSLRIADGYVKGYPYNGTQAPAHTTFFGLYDRYRAFGPGTDWELPQRWLTPPASFDRSTELNLVSTNDITGGNSGSPLLNKNLELVGLVFDGNIESLPNTYLFDDVVARTVAVDARGILEAIDDIYDADRVARELVTGRAYQTEAEADAATN